MDISHFSAIRLLRLAMLAAVVLPLILFVFLAVMNYRHAQANGDQRVERTINVLNEHALKVFETVERSIAETNEIVRDMSDADIRASEERLHQRLREMVSSLPQLKSLWVFDANGRALVNSLTYPVPDVDFSDRDYFRAHIEKESGPFIGQVLRPRDPYPSGDFFSISRRRPSADGSFRGVIQVSLRPEYFEQFYDKLQSPYAGAFAAIVRDDGVVLARYPALDRERLKSDDTGLLNDWMRTHPEGGFFNATSLLDQKERRLLWQQLSSLPVVVLAGTEIGALRAEWLSSMAGYLLFGIPATVLLLGVMGVALERTRRLYEEQGRRIAAEGALRQAQRMEAIGQLTGGVAHDFNNILMVIKGNVHRLRRDLTDEKLTRKLDMIDTAAQRGENLTRQLLAFSRRQNLMPTVIDLAQRVREFRSLLAPSLRGDIEIRIDVPSTITAVRVDVSELELAVLNLAVNARDAMPNGGTLEIGVRAVTLRGEPAYDRLKGDFVALSVADTGAGIAPDLVVRIFEPFFTTKEVGKGTGLGLSQVYGFAKQSGGTVTVWSRQGVGTTFTLYLPRSREMPQRSEPVRLGDAVTEQAGSILVVEDNSEVADIATALLNELGYRVTRVGGAPAALELLREGERFDLVFSDVVMPGGMSGVDLAHAIRRDYPDLPVVLTTGYFNAVDKPLPRGLPVLRKPYDIDELKKTLHSAMNRPAGAAVSG